MGTTETVVEITTVEILVETAAVTCGTTGITAETNDQPADSTTETTEAHVTWDDQWAAETNDQVDSAIDQLPTNPKIDHPDSETEMLHQDDQWAAKIDHPDSVIGQKLAVMMTHQEETITLETPHELVDLEISDLTKLDQVAVDSVIDQGTVIKRGHQLITIGFNVISTGMNEQLEAAWIQEDQGTKDQGMDQGTDQEITRHVSPVEVTTHHEGEDSLAKNPKNLSQLHHLLKHHLLKNRAHQHQPPAHLITKEASVSVMDGLKFKCDKNG